MERTRGLESLGEDIEGREWYHTLELAPGVVTPGWFDTRQVAAKLPIPDSLAGKRCLDIGTFDGFWAFEMERRGAEEVVAIDVNDPAGWDWPAGSEESTVAAIARRKAQGTGFEIAHRALGSDVERRELSVYELEAAELGRFDLIYLGSLLLHLRDPVGALASVRSVCAGRLIVCDAIDPVTTALARRRPMASLDGVGRPWWWLPNLAGLVRMVEAGGFEPVSPARRLRMPAGRGQPRIAPTPRLLASRIGRVELSRRWLGDPHAVVVARPIPTASGDDNA